MKKWWESHSWEERCLKFSQAEGKVKVVLIKKLMNNWSKTEMENFIWANLKIITREIVFQETLRTILIRSQSTVIQVFKTKAYNSNYIILTVYTIEIYATILYMTPYRINREDYLLKSCDSLGDWEGMLSLKTIWLMRLHNTH